MQGADKPTEYRIGRAIVRMHGTPDRDKLERAVAQLMQQVQKKPCSEGRGADEARSAEQAKGA